MMKTKDVLRMTLLVSVVLLATFSMLRLFPAVRFLLLLLLFGVLPLLLMYIAWQAVLEWRARKRNQAFLQTPIGQLVRQQQICQQQIDELREERKSIQKSIADLKDKSTSTTSLSEEVMSRTNQLLRGFEQEDDLRLTKIQFYEKCLQKLTTIREQFEWLEQLEEKQAELEHLQEKHYDQLAEMEEMRWEVEKERVQLETMESLTTRMQKLTVVDDALHLQKQLDQMLAQ